MLLCNLNKTKVIHLTSRYNKHRIPLLNFQVWNLGVLFDKNLTFSKHINETCKKAVQAIRSIGRIRKHLSKNSLKRLVNALVISRLDYSNSLLYGVPKYELEKLQRVQNTAARLYTWTSKFDHITPALKDLHWLPIATQIN